jgi:speckle-type POZ protein
MAQAPPPPVPADSWCRTAPCSDTKHTFAWTIEQVISLAGGANEDFSLDSSEFTIRDNSDKSTSWMLQLRIKRDEKNSQCFKLSLSVFKRPGPQVNACCDISLLDGNNEIKSKVKRGLMAFRKDLDDGYPDWSASFSWAPINDTPKENCVTIVCDFTIQGCRVWAGCKYPVDNSATINDRSQQQLSVELSKSFKNGNFADMEVVCQDKVFKCHQLMLSARSPVFRAMFLNNTVEASARKVEIEDLPPNILEAMLLFIYSGSVPNLAEVAGELLAAAEKYQLDHLKALCEDELIQVTNLSNAIVHLQLGDTYQAKDLKRRAMDLVAFNLKDMLNNPEWKEQLISQPDLLAEVAGNLWERAVPSVKPAA